jgi:class 3 adenylate cyclase
VRAPSKFDCEEVPGTRHAFEFVVAAVGEGQTGAHPGRISSPVACAASIMSDAQRMARARLSNVDSIGSAVVFTSTPPWRGAAGIAVHIGARVAGLSRPGEVLVSGTVPPLVNWEALLGREERLDDIYERHEAAWRASPDWSRARTRTPSGSAALDELRLGFDAG